MEMKGEIYQKGETLKMDATIEKVKKGVPTVLSVGDRRYILSHKDQYQPPHKKKKRD